MSFDDFTHVTQFVNDSVEICGSWFIHLLSSSSMTQNYLVWIFIMLVGRFFLMPILGAGIRDQGSDTVKSIKNRNKGSKNHE